jgi:hypothetical protein
MHLCLTLHAPTLLPGRPLQDRWVSAGMSSTGGGDVASGGSEAGARSQPSLEMPPFSLDLGSLYRIDEGTVKRSQATAASIMGTAEPRQLPAVPHALTWSCHPMACCRCRV